jgi:hypothetical protein
MKQILFSSAIALLLFSCEQKGTVGASDLVQNSNTANGTADKSTLPEIKFDVDSVSFGTIKMGDQFKYDFKFKNTGKGPLLISDASASCGCTVPSWPKQPIQAGDNSEIKVEFNPKGPGAVTKTITVTSNAEPSQKVLKIYGTVIENPNAKPNEASH